MGAGGGCRLRAEAGSVTNPMTVNSATTRTIHIIIPSPSPPPSSPLSRYHEPAVHLASKGFLVSAYDAQGHGRSQGLDQCYFRKLGDLIDDSFSFMETVMKKRALAAGLGEFKPFIWGQSFGGLILCRAAELKAVSDGRSEAATTLYRAPVSTAQFHLICAAMRCHALPCTALSSTQPHIRSPTHLRTLRMGGRGRSSRG